MLDFGVLGPFEVEGDCGPLSLGGQKQRALLTLNAGRVGSTDELRGEQPPRTAEPARYLP
jgi:hypothetical protein